MESPKQMSLARLQTPLKRLQRDPIAGGVGMWVKRDDLTGVELSGNKVRKLEFLLPDALESGATTLVTCGGIQSNHARATALTAVQNGLKAHLILRGSPPELLSGNVLLAHLIGADITWVTPEEYQERSRIFERVETQLRDQGETPYRIPEGGSNALGVFGYRGCYREIIAQCEDNKVTPEFIYVAVGSGGTMAGLLAGWAESGFKGPVPVGIPVCDNASFFTNKIERILAEYHARWGKPIPSRDQFHLLDGFVGDGYAQSRPEELDHLISLARMEGLILDPVYTMKAFRGALAHRQERNRRTRPCVFIHTGGLFGLFGAKDNLPL